MRKNYKRQCVLIFSSNDTHKKSMISLATINQINERNGEKTQTAKIIKQTTVGNTASDRITETESTKIGKTMCFSRLFFLFNRFSFSISLSLFIFIVMGQKTLQVFFSVLNWKCIAKTQHTDEAANAGLIAKWKRTRKRKWKSECIFVFSFSTV